MFKAIFQAISTFYHWSEAIAHTYFSILPLVSIHCRAYFRMLPVVPHKAVAEVSKIGNL